MTLYQVKLRWVAFFLAAILVFYGLALALAGLALLLGDHIVGGIAAAASGGALAVYGVKVARAAWCSRYAYWLKDISHLPEIGPRCPPADPSHTH